MSRRLSREDKAAIERAGLLHRLAVENFYAMPLERLRRVVAAIDQPALTDAEREAVEWAIEVDESLAQCSGAGTGGEPSRHAVALRALLARLGGGQ